jgi:hypothetical protein
VSAPARRDCNRDAGERQPQRRPPSRLAISGEIRDDAEAKGDRQPWHQPARRDFGKRPLREQAAQPRGMVGKPGRQHEPGAPARGVDILGPSFGARPALLFFGHGAVPPTLTSARIMPCSLRLWLDCCYTAPYPAAFSLAWSLA